MEIDAPYSEVQESYYEKQRTRRFLEASHRTIISPEAQSPRLESNITSETVVEGFTPTRTGNWIDGLVVQVEQE